MYYKHYSIYLTNEETETLRLSVSALYTCRKYRTQNSNHLLQCKVSALSFFILNYF